MSNSIDERVVILKFDNKDFEANAQTSLGTLEKLNGSLNFKDSAKGLSAIAVSSKDLGLSGIGEAVDGLQRKFSALGVIGMTALSEITKKALSAGASVVKGMLNPIIEGGKRRALNLEQADFMLRGIISDEAEVTAIMDAASNSVDGTAYSLDVAAKAAAQFAAAGVKSGDDLDNAMKAVAGTAATFNADYQGVADIFNKIASSGRVMGEEFNQLSSRGVPATETLVDYMNGVNEGTIEATDSLKAYIQEITEGMQVAGEDIVAFRKAGVISFELFSAAMSNAFGDHAKDANRTFTGALSNVQAALARIGALFYGPLLANDGPVVEFLNALRKNINAVKEAISPFAEAFTTAVSGMIKSAADFLNTLAESKVGKFASSISKLSQDVGGIFTKTFNATEIDKSANSIEKVADAVKMVSEEEAQAAWDIRLEGTYGNGQERVKNLEAVGLSYRNVQDYVNALYDANFDLAKMEIQVGESGVASQEDIAAAQEKATEETKKQLDQMSPLLKIWVSIKNIAQGVKNIGISIAKVFKAIGKAFASVFSANEMTSGLITVTDKFAKFTEKLILSDEAAEKVQKAFSTIFSVFKTVATVVGKVASVFGSALFNGLSLAGHAFVSLFSSIGNFAGKIKDAADNSERFQKVVGFLKSIWEKFASAVANSKDNILALFEKLKESEGVKRLGEELGHIRDIIGDKLSPVMGFFLNQVDKITGGKLKLPSIDTIANTISSVLEKIANFIKNIREGNSVLSSFFNIFKKNGGDGKGGGILNFVGDLLPTDASNIWESIKEFGQNFVEKAKETFANLDSSDAVEGIKTFFSNMFEKLKGVDWAGLSTIVLNIVKIAVAFRQLKSLNRLTEAAAGALSSMGGMFKSLGDLAESAKTKFKMDSFKTFAIAVAVLAGAMWVMAKIPSDQFAQAAEGLIISMGVMLGAIEIISKINDSAGKLASVGVAFTGMGAGLLLAAIALQKFSTMDWEMFRDAGLKALATIAVMAAASRLAGGIGSIGFTGMAVALYLIMPALKLLSIMAWGTVLDGAGKMAAVMVALAGAARIASGAKGGVLTMLGIAVSLDLLLPPLLLMSLMPWEKTIAAAGSLAGVMLALGGAAKLASGASGGAKTMLAMAVPIAAAAISLAVLATIDWQSLVTAAGSLAGVMIATAAAARIAEGAISGALTIGILLTLLTAAFYILVSLDPGGVLTVAEGLGLALLSMTAAIGILGNMPITAGLTAAANLSEFIGIIAAVATAIGAIFTEFPQLSSYLDTGIQIAEKIGEFVGSLIAGFGKGLTSTLPDIGANLGAFYDNAAPFFTGMKNVDGSVFSGLSSLAGALAKLTGGNLLDRLTHLFSGGNSMADVGKALSDFAEPMADFCRKTKSITPDMADSAGTAIGIAKVASEKLKDIKEFKIKGVDSLSEFAGSFYVFAALMAKVQADAVQDALNAVTKTKTSLNGLSQNSGNFSSLGAFGDSLKTFATDFMTFSIQAAGVRSDAVDGIVAAVKQVVSIAKTAGNTSLDSLKSFTKSMSSFVSGFSAASAKTANMGGSSLSGMQNQINMLAQIAKTAGSVNTGSLSTFVNGFNEAGSKGVSGFVNAFTGAAGRARGAVAVFISSAMSGLHSSAGSGYNTAYYVGSMIAQGLINGLNSRLAQVRAISAEIGRIAAQNAAKGAQVRSPSRITIKTGRYIGEGLIVGMKNLSGRVGKAGYELGEISAQAVSSAVGRISDLLSAEDDLTITPVLDLSGVERDASQIGSLLDQNQSIGLVGRINSVNNSVTGINRHRDNDDVVNAIGKLQDSMRNLGGDNYNINGVTYDDGSNITDAVRALIRAARVERRT